MTKRILVALCVAALLGGCPKEISSEERLERETARGEAGKTASAEQLGKMKCDDVGADLNKARDDKASEEARLSAYVDLYERLKSRSQKFEEAMSRNPDLAYQEGTQDLVQAREGCVQATADVRLELESLVREIMQLLIVKDVRSGQEVKVARLNFESLRSAIEKLELDDRDALLQKISNAEKEVEVKSEPRKRPK